MNNAAAPMTLSPEVREILGRQSAEAHQSLTHGVRFLAALNAKAQRTGSPIFEGVGLAEKARRRRRGLLAKASRKANRA